MRYYSSMRTAISTRKPRPPIPKWVWGGCAAGIVLLIGVGITVGILVSNNTERSVSSSSSQSVAEEEEESSPIISNSSTIAPTITPDDEIDTTNATTTTDAPVPSPTTLDMVNNSTTTLTPSVGSIIVDDPTTTTTAAPSIRRTTVTTTTTPTVAPIVSTTAPAPTTSFPTVMNAPTTTVFYAHGDIPYDGEQTIILESQMKSIPSDAEFIIFVGDLRDAGDDKPCIAQEFEDAASLFRMSPVPVFVIQGDNDISDCPNYDEGKVLWMKEFVGFETKYWNHTFNIKRHTEEYPDNFAFIHKQSLFIGLNIIGGDTRDVEEWETRLSSEATWTIDLIRQYQFEYSQNNTFVGRVIIFGHANPGSRHASFFQALSSFINFELMNSIPIIYINGDKHEWMYTENFYDNPSWLRIGVTGLGAEPLLRVSVESDGTFLPPAQAYELERFL